MKRKFILSICIGLLPLMGMSQLTITTKAIDRPSPAFAAVDVQIPKGVIIPRLTQAERRLIEVDSTVTGLIVYQTDKKAGYYGYDGRSWVNLMPVKLESFGSDIVDEDSTLDISSFSKVAFSGSYYDLKNQPVFTVTDPETGTTIQFARVAYTGDYNDLSHQPVIPASFPTLQTIAYTGDYNDLDGVPTIPHYLKDLPEDEYYHVTTLKERNTWNSTASIPIPTKLSDLADSYAGQTVTDNDTILWNRAMERTVLTSLRDLEQDTAHRLITRGKKEEWNSYAQTKIPSALSDMSSDEYNVTVSYAEKQTWDASSARPVPTRLSELTQDEWYQTVTDAEIAKWDASVSWAIPTSLRDLEQDTAHRLITKGKKEEWNSYAQTKIPSALSDMSSDEYNVAVSYAEKQTWDASAARTVPTKLSELEYDEFAQLVTDADIARWDSSVVRPTLTRLRDLEQDAEHRTLTKNQITSFTNASAREIPTYLGSLATDKSHIYLTKEEIELYDEMIHMVGFSGDYRDLTNLPFLPDSLCQVFSDDNYSTITEAERKKWNDMTKRTYKTKLDQLKEDKNHRIPVVSNINDWTAGADKFFSPNAAKTVAFTGSYNDLPFGSNYRYEEQASNKNFITTGHYSYLSNRPQVKEVAMSGDYRHLSDRPEQVYAEQMTMSYKDLVDTPYYKNKSALYPGEFKDLEDWQTFSKMSHYKSDADAGHVGKSDYDNFTNMANIMYKQTPGAPFNGNTTTKDFKHIKVAADVTLPSGTINVGDQEMDYNDAYGVYNPTYPDDNEMVTFEMAKKMDMSAKDNIIDPLTGKSILPCGSIIFWARINGSNIPTGWTAVHEMKGLFPAGVGNETETAPGRGAGENFVKLEYNHFPPHQHQLGNVDGIKYYWNGSSTNTTNITRRHQAGNFNLPTGPYGVDDVVAHENRPPYYAIYILKKTGGCE